MASPPTVTPGSEEPPAKRFKPSYDNFITILSGSTEQRFTVHEDLVCSNSAFFTTACSSSWKEGNEGVVRLPTVELWTMKLYIHYLYTRSTDLEVVADWQPRQGQGVQGAKTLALFQLYVAADMFIDDATKNKTIDQLLMLVWDNQFKIDVPSIKYVWDSTNADSPLRTLNLDTMMAWPKSKTIRKWGPGLCHGSLLDLAIRQMEARESATAVENLTLANRCTYHVHAEGEAKCS